MQSKVLLVVAALICVVVAQVPDVITINLQNLQPEGIEFKEGLGFLVGSLGLGTVFKVDDTGVATPFVSSSSLINTVGLQVDLGRNRLYFVNINFGAAVSGTQGVFLGGVVIADLTTGVILDEIDLTNVPGALNSSRLINDLVQDAQGNIYATDSFGSAIYKIDTQGVASVFAIDARWVGQAQFNNIGLNGIEFVDNFLLVAQSGVPSRLWKVPILNGGTAGSPTEVIVNGVALEQVDGIYLLPNGNLVTIANSGAISELATADNWVSASLVTQATSKFPTATTGVLRNNEFFVTHAYFQNQTSYEIEKIIGIPFFNAGSTLIANVFLVILALVFVI